MKVGKQKEDCNHSFNRLNKAARLAVGKVKKVSNHVPRSLKRPQICPHQFSLQAEGKHGTKDDWLKVLFNKDITSGTSLVAQ